MCKFSSVRSRDRVLRFADGVFLSQIFSWVADTAVTLVLYCARYRTEAHLRRAILKEPEKPKSLAP